MLRLASVLALAVAGRIPSAVAFSPMIRAARIAGGQTTSLNYYPDETSLNPNYQQQGGGGGGGGIFPDTQHDISLAYDRALDCANNFGMCDIDELLDLSEDLDEYQGCFVEDGPEACENEIDDRQELSEALLVQGEMREHERYVGEGNVFPMSYNANADAGMNERGGDNSNPRTSPWRNENQFAWGDDQSSMGV